MRSITMLTLVTTALSFGGSSSLYADGTSHWYETSEVESSTSHNPFTKKNHDHHQEKRQIPPKRSGWKND